MHRLLLGRQLPVQQVHVSGHQLLGIIERPPAPEGRGAAGSAANPTPAEKRRATGERERHLHASSIMCCMAAKSVAMDCEKLSTGRVWPNDSSCSVCRWMALSACSLRICAHAWRGVGEG